MGLLESGYYSSVPKRVPAQVGQVVSDYPTTPIKELSGQAPVREEEERLFDRPGAGKIERQVRRTMSDYATVFKGTSEAVGEELKSQLGEKGAKGATGFDYFKMGFVAPIKIAGAFATQLPIEIAKAPLRLSLSMLEAENRFISKQLGVKQSICKSYNLPTIHNVPILGEINLGEVKSFGGSYDDDIKNGMSPGTAYLNTGIRLGVDSSIVFLPLDAYRAVFSPRIKVMRKGKVTLADGKPAFAPLPPKQKLRMTAEYKKIEAQFKPEKFTKQKGPDMTVGDMFVSKQNPNVAYMPMSEEGIKILGIKGGTPQNILYRKTKIGNGLVQSDAVKLMGSRYTGIKSWTKAQLEKKFGRSRVIEGEFGPEIIIKSVTARIGEKGMMGVAPRGKVPSAAAVAKPADIKGWEKMTDVQKAEALGAEPVIEAVPSSGKIISALGEAKRTDPACVKTFRETLSKNPEAIPERVIFSDSIENASKQYLSNIEKGTSKQLEGFTHLRASVDGKIIESKVAIEGAKPFTENQIKEFVSESKTDIAAAEKLGVEPEVTSVMRRPLKGQGDKMVKGSQIDEIKYLQEQKKFGEEDLFLVSKMLNGKTNLNELTQNEAFAISETLRGIADPLKAEAGRVFDLPDIGGIGTFVGLNKSWTHQGRRWMADYQREAMARGLNHPIYDEVYIPIQLGLRLRDGAFIRFNDSLLNDIYGKYAKPKFSEERRLIDAYLRGDREIIALDKTLSDEVKAELTKIADSQKAWYEKARKDPAGTMSEKYAGIYSPELREKGATKLYKTKGELQKELTAFYKFQRTEEALTPYIDDPLTLMQIYAHGFYTQKFVKPAYDHAVKVIDPLPPKVKEAMTDHVQEVMGYKDDLEKALNRFGEKLSKNTGGRIPPDALTKGIDVLSKNAFFGALLSPMAPIRNFFQFAFISIPDLGFKYALQGWKSGFDPTKVREMRRRGILTNTGTEYGGEAVKEPAKGLTGLAGKGIEKYTNAQEWALKATYGTMDTISRTGAATGVEQRFYDHWNALVEGKITQSEFEHGIDMASYDPITQQMLRSRFSKGDQASIEEANEIQLMLTVDREHFPYRKGTQTRAHYGMRGREGLKFSQWVWEYSFTISDWIKRGQWDKVVRFLGIGSLVKNTFEEAYGIDISKWVTQGPFGGMPMGPMASLIVETMSMAKNISYQNHEAVDDNWRNISNVIKLHGGVAVGPVQKARNDKFAETIRRREAGVVVSPDPEKPFSIISSTGKHVRWASFTELLLDTSGFLPIEESEQSSRLNVTYLETKKRNKQIDEAMREYVNTGDIAGALESLIDDNVPIPDIRMKMKSYGVDLDDRLYERLPVDIKIKLFKLFYPSD